MTNYEKYKDMIMDFASEYVGEYITCQLCPNQKTCSHDSRSFCSELFHKWMESEVTENDFQKIQIT